MQLISRPSHKDLRAVISTPPATTARPLSHQQEACAPRRYQPAPKPSKEGSPPPATFSAPQISPRHHPAVRIHPVPLPVQANDLPPLKFTASYMFSKNFEKISPLTKVKGGQKHMPHHKPSGSQAPPPVPANSGTPPADFGRREQQAAIKSTAPDQQSTEILRVASVPPRIQ